MHKRKYDMPKKFNRNRRGDLKKGDDDFQIVRLAILFFNPNLFTILKLLI